MARESERMRVLILDLLTLARLDAQRAMPLEVVEVNEVVRDLLAEGVPVFRGAFGLSRGQQAVKIDQRVRRSKTVSADVPSFKKV